MFSLVSDESTQNLGIDVHRLSAYEMQTVFLSARAVFDSTKKDFNAAVTPNYDSLADLKIGEDKTGVPNGGRWKKIYLGDFSALETIYDNIMNLETWFKTVLSHYGAEYRLLIEEGNSYHLIPDDKAPATRYGDVIKQARALQAFDLVRREQPVDYDTVVGRIMPMFVRSIGVEGYNLEHDMSEDGFGKVRFLFNEIATFTFYKPLGNIAMPYMQRHNYKGNDHYFLTFEGELNGQNFKYAVIDWLIGAMRERQDIPYDSAETYLDRFESELSDVWMGQDMRHIPASALQPASGPSRIITLAQTMPDVLPENVLAFKPR